jgi:cytochrome b5
MQIYDVTKYLEDHPGGADVLLEATGTACPDSLFLLLPSISPCGISFSMGCMTRAILSEGKDATEEFDDAGHSKSAKDLMQDYFIGELDLDPTPDIPEMEVFRKEQDTGFASKLMDNVVQYWAIPAAVIGISAVVAILYARRK